MSSEVPSDLIKQSQIGFREDAGLSSYKPTLKSLPTEQNSISATDTSNHCIKCQHCNEKLLRGSHSLICIYCGQCQAKDIPPQPIAFNSTTSYSLLLQSLHLNASEISGSVLEENSKNKGRAPLEAGKTLGEVLDVQIEWRDESEKDETDSVNKTFDYNSLLNLDTVGFKKLLRGSERDSGSDVSEEQSTSNRNDGENLSLLENDDVSPEADARSSSASFKRDSEVEDCSSTHDDSRAQNEDSQAVSSDLRDDCDSPSEHDVATQSSLQNEASKTTADVSSDLRRSSSSGDDTIRAQNDDSKTASVSSDLSGDDLVRHDAEIVSSSTKNEDSKTTDDAEIQHSGDDTDIPSVNSNLQNEDSETTHIEDLNSENQTKNIQDDDQIQDNELIKDDERIEDKPIQKD